MIGALNKFRLFIGKNRINIIDINPSICEGFKNYLINKSGLSGETPYGYWKQFKAVIKKAILEDIIIKNPCDNIRFKKVNGSKQLKKNILTKDEIQKIALTYCGNDDVKKAFLFACFTGLGLAEIRKLKWGAINNNKIKIYREKTGEQIINDLPSTALKIIGKPKPSKEYIFNKLPSDTSVNKTLQNWIKRANIDKKITFYCGRHTFATQLLINGANLKTVADCLGHTTTQNTVKYLNYVDSLKKGAINSLPDIDLF